MLECIKNQEEKTCSHVNFASDDSSKYDPPPPCLISINGESIKQIDKFLYLGSMVTADGRCETEIKRRIGIVKSSFKAVEKLLINRTLKKETRIRLLKCYVWATLLYVCETWTVSESMDKRLMAAEMWFLRRMWKVRRYDKITNEEVLRRAETKRSLIADIYTRQLSFLGHVLRKEGLEGLMCTGRINGRRSRGRPRKMYLDSLTKITGKKKLELLQGCHDRAAWHNMIANARSGMAQ
ncbi:hypothetical protein AC249_AIPGENE15317 [Exaiptasia diaphana]|nr:hypothetical protein AC249_AIPGENE15317 [Exaiptasia diaphana]